MPHGTESGNDNYPQLNTAHENKAPEELTSSVAYHRTLIDQHRQLQPATCKSNPEPDDDVHVRKGQMLRSWIPFGSRAPAGAAGDSSSTTPGLPGAQQSSGTQDGRINRLNGGPARTLPRGAPNKEMATMSEGERAPKTLPLVPHTEPTRQDVEEYEALPLAIQRKFFSSAERLRLAQSSGKFLKAEVNRVPRPAGTSARLLSTTDTRSWAAAFDLHNFRSRAAELDIGRDYSQERPVTSPLPVKPDFQGPSDFLVLANLPAKIREKHLTREEQLLLARQLRQSVLLDAADEALCRLGQRRNKNPTPDHASQEAPIMAAVATNMASTSTKTDHQAEQEPLGDSFRWFDEDDELDLRFAVEDPQVVPRSVSSLSKRESHPFRRGLSLTKMSFSRSSITSFRPPTGESYGPVDTRSASPVQGTQHGRRRSRAFSIMGPRHSAKASVASIDVAAAHYQDPEARAKLRVYLASPQKFDEAVEFGFPSVEAANAMPRRTSTRLSRHLVSDEADKLKTFLSDDRSSTYSEDLSMPDSESPKTPQILDKDSIQALELPFDFDEKQFKLSDGYLHAPAHSREMTLRMTLTRPDLRAQEDQMYGWQPAPKEQPAWRHSRAMTQSRWELAPPTSQARDLHKESIDKIFAEIDQELGPTPAEGGPMKRLWKKVRRS
ncbi:uncharacterized protein B0I36DRAFT_323321 [Microdochium trichocladiopsis]|uniref:Mucin n=1 Tax=Microdochium trichocladiopsis TaxID=1682393 RepID=A0A9P8Y772_9PEZI|nr:uncharacterized protein B0I36DRAFT_323321 [Microdochium trichocladiopsis]KAH7031168.1 hypothetical protein B0I36DRAFT_323321 [Microdochium trichocladiopsis]